MLNSKRGLEKYLGSKKSQITIFVIIAILLVAVIVLVFMLTPASNISTPTSPSVRVDECVKPKLKEGLDKIGSQGGIDPENTYRYEGEEIEYLCFTNEYYKTCTMQRPLLRQYVERELLDYVGPKARDCIEEVKGDLEARGYDVSGKSEIDLMVNSGSVEVIFSGFSIRKGETGKKYNQFSVRESTDLYRLLMLSTSILNWEARYGDSEITTYMGYYPEVKVQKLKQLEGTKIYRLEDRESGDKFTFATRSLAWPPGYGSDQIYNPSERRSEIQEDNQEQGG